MKRNHLCVWTLFGLSLLFPALKLLCRLLRYTLYVQDGLIWAVVTTLLYVTAGVLLLAQKDKQLGRLPTALLAATLLLNQISMLMFLFSTQRLGALLLIAVWFPLTCVLVGVYVRSVWLKASAFFLSGLLVIPVLLLLMASQFGAENVPAHKISPNGTYCAEVLVDDQGALGGNTMLYAYREDQSFYIGSFVFRKDEQELYFGNWGAYHSLRWEDDRTLNFNGTIYHMTDYFAQ